LAETAKRSTREQQYLLGSLSDDEMSRVEETFFSDDARFEELEVLEDELIDGYVQAELSPEARRQFETRLRKSPRLVERVHFAKVLAEKAATSSALRQEAANLLSVASEPSAPAKRRWWQNAFAPQPAFRIASAACLAFLLVGGDVLVTGWLRLRKESERLNSERAALQQQKEALDRQLSAQKANREPLTAEPQQQLNQRAAEQTLLETPQRDAKPRHSSLGSAVTVFLTPGLTRSAGAGADFKFGPDTAIAQFNLRLERDEYGAYNVTARRGDKAAFKRNGIRARHTSSGSVLVIAVPVKRLPAGDYSIHVDGRNSSGQSEGVEDYSFRVLKNSN
jgi:anti-sigma factor RsiW